MKKRIKKIISLIIVCLWLVLIIATLVFACLSTPNSYNIFKGLLFADFALPVIAYAMLLMYRTVSKRDQ